MTGWIVVAVIVAVVVLEALRRCANHYSGSVERVVGRWRVVGSDDCTVVCFDKERVGYIERGDTLETFSFAVVCRRLIVEKNCTIARYRMTFSDDDHLQLIGSDGSQKTLERIL